MRSPIQHSPGVRRKRTKDVRLDVVIPYTTQELTRTAVAAGERLSAGLEATLRLVRIQVVPYPLSLEQSPVDTHLLLSEMQNCTRGLPVSCEIRLARDFREGVVSSLRRHSVVVMGYHPRLWKTSIERFADDLRREGHQLMLVNGKEPQ